MSLSNEEKTGIIEQHKKSQAYILYGLELDLKEAQSVGTPDAEVVSGINAKIADVNAKIDALNSELNNLN